MSEEVETPAAAAPVKQPKKAAKALDPEAAALAQAEANSPWAELRIDAEGMLNSRVSAQREAAEEAEQAKEKVKRASSRPWNASDRRLKPDRLALTKSHAGWTPRWIRKPEADRRLREGWVVAKRENYGSVLQPGDKSGLGSGSAIERNEMVLMEIPNTVLADIKAYQRAFNANQSSSATEDAMDGGLYKKREHGKFGRKSKRPDEW